jgi:hypothetical protein
MRRAVALLFRSRHSGRFAAVLLVSGTLAAWLVPAMQQARNAASASVIL